MKTYKEIQVEVLAVAKERAENLMPEHTCQVAHGNGYFTGTMKVKNGHAIVVSRTRPSGMIVLAAFYYPQMGTISFKDINDNRPVW